MAATFLILVIFTFLAHHSTEAEAHNITAILDEFPEYSVYNSYLTQTKISDDINSRETITVLVVTNPLIINLFEKQPLWLIKKALQLHTLLDYFDASKLHSNFKSTLVTTLLQTTGKATGRRGFLNITDLKDGNIGFMSPAAESFQSFYTRSVGQIPYNYSVLEISNPVVYPGLFDNPATEPLNITSLLNDAGCKTFASWITNTSIINMFYALRGQGLTAFAPSDRAFKAPGAPNLTEMSQLSVTTLLMYHAVPEYVTKPSLLYKNGSMSTLATNGWEKYTLTVVTSGDIVSLSTGVDTSRVTNTVVDAIPLSILAIDKLLLPVEQFGRAPSRAPSAPSAPPESSSTAAPAPVEPNAPHPSPEVSPSVINSNANNSLKNPSPALALALVLIVLFVAAVPLF